jgi:hypothetical protein
MLEDMPKEFTAAEPAPGRLRATRGRRLRHFAPVLSLSETLPRWARPSVPLGHRAPIWRERAA